MPFLDQILRRLKGGAPQAPDKHYIELREMSFTLKPEDLKLTLSEPDEVWGILMDEAMADGQVYTVRASTDGAISLYFSNGGGFIGCGSHPGPQQAAHTWLAAAKDFIALCEPARAHPLPKPGHIRFYFLSGSQILTIDAKENDLKQRRHPLWPLFYQGHTVISEIRQLDESGRLRAGSSVAVGIDSHKA